MFGTEKATKTLTGRDRLSELPDPIIDNILSRLPSPEEIVKTKILSKLWKERPCNHPTVCFKLGAKSTFNHNVDRIIKSLHRNHVSINKFELQIQASESDSDTDQIVDSWMKMAIDSSVEEIYLSNDGQRGLRFPPSILAAKSLKSLRIKSLSFPDELFGIRTSWSCLKRLDLCYVKDDMLHHIISQSPKLEELLLKQHEGAGKLQLNNLHCLKYVYIYQLARRTTCEVEAPSLERLSLKIYPFWQFQLTAMENLRSLDITSSYCPNLDSLLCKIIPTLPMLETLRLDSWLKKLEIRSRSIKVIILELHGSPEEVEIDAPNLYRLHYRSRMPPKDFPPRGSPGRWEAYIRHDEDHDPSRSPWNHPSYRSQRYLHPDLIRSPWFVKVRETLSKPSPFQFFYISCGSPYFKGKEIGLEDFDDPNMLYTIAKLDHLKLDVGASCPNSFSALVASLFWNSRPNYLSIGSTKTNVEHIELFCKELKATPDCCEGGGGFKCWRHYLKDVREIRCREIEGVLPRRSCGYANYYAPAIEDTDFCLKLDWMWD